MGIVGLYLGKVFDETKRRPIYIIRDTLNVEDRAAHLDLNASRLSAGDDPAARGANGSWTDRRA